MRLDKFLKVSRLIKRRTVANEACSTGHLSVNGKPAKPGAEVKEGDEISIRMGAKVLTCEVVSVREYAAKNEADSMYRIISNE